MSNASPTDRTLQLAVFGLNVEGGNSISSVPERLRLTWAESRRLAQEAEKLGFDAVIPVARWRGFGGETGFQERTFETLTWAAATAASTERIRVFATVHASTTHPLVAAKAMATIQEVSGGRAGLNVVAGWYAEELAMFGAADPGADKRYDHADEWLSIIRNLWTEERTNVDGTYFEVTDAVLEPKPAPAPTVMNAGWSPAAHDFAARHSDIAFVVPDSHDPAAAAEKVRAVQERAAAHGREIAVWASCYVVCRPTQEEAEEYLHRYAVDHADVEAADNFARAVRMPSIPEAARPAFLKSLAAGLGGYPLVGTPETIADSLAALRDAGIGGVALNWVDYSEGMATWERDVTPLLVERGLRA